MEKKGHNLRTQKSNVLAVGDNIDHPYRLGEAKISTKKTEKHLSVTLDSKGNWKPHFTQKIKKENSALGILLGAGIMRGNQPVLKAFMIAKTTRWPIVDSGKIATNYLGEVNKARRKEVQKFKIKVAKKSSKCVSIRSIDRHYGRTRMVRR
jgi:hypothetical protein